MQHKSEDVQLARIDLADDRYRITTDASIDDLCASIRRVGLLNPPVLRKTTTGYSPVSGFRRIRACRKLAWNSVGSRVLAGKTSEIQYMMVAICENSLQRSLNLIETARAFSMISATVEDIPTRCRIAADLKLSDNPKYIERVSRLSKLPANIQDAIVEESISLSMALALERMAPSDAERLRDLFCELKIGLNKQQEILSLVQEISAREKVSIEALFDGPDLCSIRTNPDIDRTRKRQKIRNYLKRRRYPNITAREERFERYKRNLALDRFIKIEPPPYFEGKNYTLKIQFSTLSELETHTSALCDLSKNPFMKKIVDRS